MSLEIFDKFGKLVDLASIKTEEVEVLNDDQRPAFFECIEACQLTETAEQSERAAALNVRDKMRTQAETLAAHIAANPPQTRIEAMYEVLNAGKPQSKAAPKSHPKIAHKVPRVAHEKAEAELTEARTELLAAQAQVRKLRPISAAAISKFIGTFRQKTGMEVHREMVAKQQAEKLKRVNAGLTAIEAKPEPVYKWPIEKALAANNGQKRPSFAARRK